MMMIVYPKTRSWLNLFSFFYFFFFFFFFFLLQENSWFCFLKTKKLEEKKLNQLSPVQSKLSNSRTRSQKILLQQPTTLYYYYYYYYYYLLPVGVINAHFADSQICKLFSITSNKHPKILKSLSLSLSLLPLSNLRSFFLQYPNHSIWNNTQISNLSLSFQV